MLRAGLSGGLGAGKSTVGAMLGQLGAVVIDTDQVARDVLAPGSAGERAVLAAFGPSVQTPLGSLDRSALARRVFSSSEERLALEAITHPLIRRDVEARLRALEESATGAASPTVAVVEIPLLDRARRQEYKLDVVVLVEAPAGTALERAAQRGFSRLEAKARMAAQPSSDERRAAADRVITNGGSLEQLKASVDELWGWLVDMGSAKAAPAL